ncbi:HD domain-containing protein [Paenibacillus antri]|nr:HD domain-containing protein [Paenibacillus antri]
MDLATASELGMRLLDKYGLEREHALHVERLSARLFEGVRAFAGFAPEHLGLLRFAALTHDIGHYIDERTHHLHSAYLIRRDACTRELPEREREAAAWLALNHRKRKLLEPDRYGGAERRLMARLAIVLRLADALDYEHRQEASIVSIETEEVGRGWTVRASGFDLALHRDRIDKKLSFAAAFGWDVVRVESGAS